MKKHLLLLSIFLTLAFLPGCGVKSEPDPIIKLNPKIDYTSINPDTDLLLVKDSNGKYGFIDTKGNIAIPLQFELAMPFSEGLACIATKQYHGYIDKTGKLVLKNHYLNVWPFINGHAVIVTRDNDESRYGIIDKNGTVIVQPIYKYIKLESDGMAAFQDTSNKWGYMNSDGTVAIMPQYFFADDFLNGRAAVEKEEDGPWVYIDKHGQLLRDSVSSDFLTSNSINLCFADNREISRQEIDEALRKLTPKARDKVKYVNYCGQGLYWGESTICISLLIFDKDGNEKFEALGSVGEVGDGLCAVSNREGLWGYVDLTGKQVIENSFDADYAGMFVNGIARIDSYYYHDKSTNFDKISYIDKTGKYIWKQPEHFKLDIDGNSALFCIATVAIIILFFFFARRNYNRRYAKSLETLETCDEPAPQADKHEQEQNDPS